MARIIEQKMNQAISNGRNFSGGNTTVITEDGVIKVLLHGNLIAKIGGNFIQIFDGGWQSKTTKSRLNAILQSRGWGIFQENFEWFVCLNSEGLIMPFESGMKLQ